MPQIWAEVPGRNSLKMPKNGLGLRTKSRFWAGGPRTNLAYLDDVSGRNPTNSVGSEDEIDVFTMKSEAEHRKSEKPTKTCLNMPGTGRKPSEIAPGPSSSHPRPFPAENFMYSRQRGPRTNFAGIGVCPRTDTATFREGLWTEIDPEQKKGSLELVISHMIPLHVFSGVL